MFYLLLRYFISPICDVGINPGFEFSTSGILFTIVAQVNSTVLGLSITSSVLGSPYTVQRFQSNSSFEYTLPIHSVSNVIPSSVSVVTTALIPVAVPLLTVISNVLDSISSVCV